MSTMRTSANTHRRATGFTLVELLIVIVVIAILATLAIVAYNGVQDRARVTTMQADLRNTSSQLAAYNAENGEYPMSLPGDVSASGDDVFQYTSDGSTYCLTVTTPSSTSNYHVDQTGVSTSGLCAGHSATPGAVADGTYIQDITNANCPVSRTRVVDARDNHTYWVQQMADGNCWMLTNLGYAGGGTNTYGDMVPLTDGTSGSSTYSVASYYVVPSTTNYSTEPTAPNTSTDGMSSYGYLYNWCGAMGGQATAACSSSATPTPDPGISICPSGWRLPTGNGGDVAAFNAAINSGLTDSAAGLLDPWLGQYGGYWNSSGFAYQDARGYYWTSTPYTSGGTNAYSFYFQEFYVNIAQLNIKNYAFAVRCVVG